MRKENSLKLQSANSNHAQRAEIMRYVDSRYHSERSDFFNLSKTYIKQNNFDVLSLQVKY